MTARDIIDKILKVKALKLKDQNDLAMKCKIIPNTLAVAIGRNTLSDEIVTKIHEYLGVNLDFLREGKEPILDETQLTKETSVSNNQIRGVRETFYRELIEENEEYSILPRAVLKDYKIVPDKIIDVIIASSDNEKKALKEAKELEINVLNEKILGLNEKNEHLIKAYEIELEKLREENKMLREQITPKGDKQ